MNALITKDNNGRKDVIVFHRYEEIVSDKWLNKHVTYKKKYKKKIFIIKLKYL